VPRRSPRVHQNRGIERKVLLLTLAGIATLTALVIVAWKFGGASPSTPNVIPGASQTAPRGLVFSGAGTYIEVRHASASGKVLYAGTLKAGDLNAVPGQRFWLRILHPKHLRLTLNGKVVALPARKTLRVIVTPSRTALAG